MKYVPYSGIDYLSSASNSESLCRAIRSAWRKRGHEIDVWIEREFLGVVQGKKRFIYVVRSSLYGGKRAKPAT